METEGKTKKRSYTTSGDLTHVELHAILGWINPAMLELVKRIDRFPEVYGQGSRPYRKRLSEVLDKS